MASTKDYYRILNVRSSASAGEIKNSFRRLAMKYHPDRNPDDALAAAIFKDVAEAYKVLSDPVARKIYNGERYITAEQEYEKPAETIEAMIKKASELNEKTKRIDPFRFNRDALFYTIVQLLPGDISILSGTNRDLTKKFLGLITEIITPLSSHQTKKIMVMFKPLYTEHAWLETQLAEIFRQQEKRESWDKNKIVLAVVIAVILCIIIFFAAGR